MKYIYEWWESETRHRAAEEARRARAAALMAKYGDENIVFRIMAGEVWQGMSSEQLIDSRGIPADIDTDISERRTRNIYKYDQYGAGRFRRRIVLDDGFVVRIIEKGL